MPGVLVASKSALHLRISASAPFQQRGLVDGGGRMTGQSGSKERVDNLKRDEKGICPKICRG